MNKDVDAIKKLLDWVNVYRDDFHGYCDIEKYDYADCSCGWDDVYYNALKAANRLQIREDLL